MEPVLQELEALGEGQVVSDMNIRLRALRQALADGKKGSSR